MQLTKSEFARINLLTKNKQTKKQQVSFICAKARFIQTVKSEKLRCPVTKLRSKLQKEAENFRNREQKQQKQK